MSAKLALYETQKTVTPCTQSTLVNTSDLATSATNNGGAARQTTEGPQVPIPHPLKPTYVEALGQSKPSKMKLTFVPPEIVNGKSVVKYQSLDVMLGINKWKSAAYGYVMGISPSFGAVENYARSRWGDFGFEKCFKLKSGLFLFQFESGIGRDTMLNDGPWIFAQHPFILQAWTPEAKLERKGVEKVPVWIRAPFLSLQFWNEEMLSKIGSYVGVHLFPDSPTTEFTRISYARLYVEVSAKNDLPKCVPMLDEHGNEFLQRIEYEWTPPKCSHCCLFGHAYEHCRFGGKPVIPNETRLEEIKEWRPKVALSIPEVDTIVGDNIVNSIIHQEAPAIVNIMDMVNNFLVLEEEQKQCEHVEFHLNNTKKKLKKISEVKAVVETSGKRGSEKPLGEGSKRVGRGKIQPPIK